jgi:low affinity Fe/Cu permease
MLVTSAGHEVVTMEDVDWQDVRHFLRHVAQTIVNDSGHVTLWDITALSFIRTRLL